MSDVCIAVCCLDKVSVSSDSCTVRCFIGLSRPHNLVYWMSIWWKTCLLYKNTAQMDLSWISTLAELIITNTERKKQLNRKTERNRNRVQKWGGWGERNEAGVVWSLWPGAVHREMSWCAHCRVSSENGWAPLTTTEARFVAQWVTTYECLPCSCVCLNDAFQKIVKKCKRADGEMKQRDV